MLLNRTRANDFMYKYNIDAIIASSPINVLYLTDIDCSFYRIYKEYMIKPEGSNAMIQSFAILPREEEPTVILMAGTEMFAVKSWVKNIRRYGSQVSQTLTTLPFIGNIDIAEKRIYDLISTTKVEADPFQALCSTIKDLGLERSIIGLDSDDAPIDFRERLSSKFPEASFKNCTQVLRFIRMVKSEEELQRLSKCAEINEKVGMKSLKYIGEGVKIGKAIQIYREEIAREGGLFEHYTYSKNGFGNCSNAEYQLSKGDILSVDFGCIYQMYYSDAATTIFVGKPSNEFLNIFNSIHEVLSEITDMISPGVRSSIVYEKMTKSLIDRGVSLFNCQIHGLGLDVREYPIVLQRKVAPLSDDFLQSSTDFLFEKGMVFNIEIIFSKLGQASIQIEKTFTVTKTGCIEIIPQNRELLVIS